MLAKEPRLIKSINYVNHSGLIHFVLIFILISYVGLIFQQLAMFKQTHDNQSFLSHFICRKYPTLCRATKQFLCIFSIGLQHTTSTSKMAKVCYVLDF